MLIEQAFPVERDGSYKNPKGKLVGNFEQLHAAGCLQAELDNPKMRSLFHGLMVATEDNPCSGLSLGSSMSQCPVWVRIGPNCPAFQAYHTAYITWQNEHKQALKDIYTPRNVPAGHKFYGMTIAAIAKELQVSKSEVRRRKLAGTL